MAQPDLNKAFLDEAKELLSDLENSLLELEENPSDREVINRAFRAMHTIKGSGAMFGYDEVARFTHEVETVLDQARDGRIRVDKKLLDLTLKAGDEISAMIFGDGTTGNNRLEIVSALKALVSPPVEPRKAEEPKGKEPAPETGKNAREELTEPNVYRIRFKPSNNIFQSGNNPVYLIDDLRSLGDFKIFAYTNRIPPLSEDFDPEACHVWWDSILHSSADLNAIQDVFMFVESDGEVRIQKLDLNLADDTDTAYLRLGEILVQRGDIGTKDLINILTPQKKIGELITGAGLADETAIKSALAEQETVRRVLKERKNVETSGSIRVSEDKLDKLVDLVGELVILQSRLSQCAKTRKRGFSSSSLPTEDDPAEMNKEEMLDLVRQLNLRLRGAEKFQVERDRTFSSLSEDMERLSDEMRYIILKMRMLPFGSLTTKFRRLVRDLSTELNKKVELFVTGEETELDKSILDKLSDPMIHIIRNSLDHGIEPPEARIKAGKEAVGRIGITAIHAGGDVIIKVSDDGAGLDEERIRAKAVEKGLINQDAQLSREETYMLIFRPGFSTAEKVTGVSGRGVGMDVVKKGVDSLQGSIGIESAKGEGTTLVIKLPLTLAIIDGLQVQAGDEDYIIPLQIVSECVDYVPGKSGRKFFDHRGKAIPYVSLRETFGIDEDLPDVSKIVVAGIGESRFGVVVDEVVGQCQTVIKSMGSVYKKVKSISGASISGEGKVILILDVPSIIEKAIRKTEESQNGH